MSELGRSKDWFWALSIEQAQYAAERIKHVVDFANIERVKEAEARQESVRLQESAEEAEQKYDEALKHCDQRWAALALAEAMAEHYGQEFLRLQNETSGE